MKKTIVLLLCLLSLLMCLTAGYAETITGVPTLTAGPSGSGYYATVKLSAKKGYYAYVSCTLLGSFRETEGSTVYTKKASVSTASSEAGKSASGTARVSAYSPTDTRISYSVLNVRGYWEK